MISSEHNSLVQSLQRMKKKRGREESGGYFIEGLRSVREGILSSAELQQLVVSESFIGSPAFQDIRSLCSSTYTKDVELLISVVSDRIYTKITELESPQGIGAIFTTPRISLEELTEQPGCCHLILLENLQDPGNMGTIIRTADAAGVDGILCTKGCVDPYNAKVLRSTVGSIFHLPLVFLEGGKTPEETTRFLQGRGFRVLAAHPRSKVQYFEEDLTGKTVIVIGNEANGISEAMRDACDSLITIPMPGKAESLNASVAASLMMYEVVRQNMHVERER